MVAIDKKKDYSNKISEMEAKDKVRIQKKKEISNLVP